MSKFKIGDRVRYIEEGLLTIPYGLTGTVLEENGYPYVEWDEKVRNGRDANGLGKDGHCRAQHEGYLELLEDEEFTTEDISISVEKTITISILEDEYELTEEDTRYIIKELQKALGDK